MNNLKIFLILNLFLSLTLNAQNGNIGIGTDNPQSKLHVAGDIQVEDLSGNGERPIIATPEGKLKAINNSEPNPSNADTLRAKYIELKDATGASRFILDANTGEFQMIDNDTVWYELEVNSDEVFKENKRLSNGAIEETSNPEQIAARVATALSILNANNQALANKNEAINLLTLGTTTRYEEITFEGETANQNSFERTYFIRSINDFARLTLNISEGNQVNFIDIENQNPSTSIASTLTTDEGELPIIKNTSIRNKTTTLFQEIEAGTTPIAEISEGMDDNNIPFQLLTDFAQGTQNKQTPSENTITHLETGNSVSTQIDENGVPKLQFTLGENLITTIDAEKIEQTNLTTETTTSAGIGEIIDFVEGVSVFAQTQAEHALLIEENTTAITELQATNDEQDIQIAQNTADIADLQAQNQTQNTQIAQNATDIVDLQARNLQQNEEFAQITLDIAAVTTLIPAEGELIAEKFTAIPGGKSANDADTQIPINTATEDKATLAPKGLTIQTVNSDKADLKKDKMTFTSSDGTTFSIDLDGISKSNGGKVLNNLGIEFDVDNQTLEMQADLEVFGDITEIGKKVTKMKHPNKSKQYLQHSSIDANELLNVYSGNATTNANGTATIQLPDYIEAYNTDFRYQVSTVGSFAQAIIAKEIANHQFVIRTNEPNVKVSWQITGVRNDAYAQEKPIGGRSTQRTEQPRHSSLQPLEKSIYTCIESQEWGLVVGD